MTAILVLGCLAFVAVVLVWVIARHRDTPGQRAKRGLAAMAPTTVAAAADGAIVKLVGGAAANGAPRTAPFSGRPCVFFQVRITESAGEVDTDLALDTAEGDFLLEDRTGRARVAVRDVEAALREDFWIGRGMAEALAPVKAEILARHGIADAPGLSFHEAIVPIGAAVIVAGAVRRPDPCARAGGPPVDLLLESPPEAPLRISCR